MIEPVCGLFPAIILFRHGQTDYNASRRFQGQSHTPLNAKGREQGRLTGELVANLLERLLPAGSQVRECRTSDLARARETAELVARSVADRGLIKLEFEDEKALREFNIGGLQDYTVEEFERDYPGVLSEFYVNYERDPYSTRYPGSEGESRRMLLERLAPLVRRVNASWHEARSLGSNPFDAALAQESDPLRVAQGLSLWSAHGGVIDSLLELLGQEVGRDRHIVGNGDVLVLVPPSPEGGVREPTTVARELGCKVTWRLFRHYQVGDNVAAALKAATK